MPKGRVGLGDSLRGRALCYALQYSLGVLLQSMQKIWLFADSSNVFT